MRVWLQCDYIILIIQNGYKVAYLLQATHSKKREISSRNCVLFSLVYLDSVNGCRFFGGRTGEIILAIVLQGCPLRDLSTLLVDKFCI